MKAAKKICAVLLTLVMLTSACAVSMAEEVTSTGGDVSSVGGNSGSGGSGGTPNVSITLPYENDFSGETPLENWETDAGEAAKFAVTEDKKLAICVNGTSVPGSEDEQGNRLQGKAFLFHSGIYRWEVSADIEITEDLLTAENAVRSDLRSMFDSPESGFLMLGFKRGAKNDGDQDAQEVGAVETETEKFANVWRYWDYEKKAFVVSDEAVTAGVHTLKIKTVGRDVSYLVDGKDIGSTTIAEPGVLSGIGLHAYNFGSNADYTGYSVLWDNVSAQALPEETGSAAYVENSEGEKVWHFSVQEALDAAENGDTVTVLAGAHDEDLTLNAKAVTLKGEIKDDQAAEISTLTVNGDTDGLRLENLTFTGTKADEAGERQLSLVLEAESAIANTTISNCAFLEQTDSDETSVAISGKGVSGLTVDHCTFEGYTYAAQFGVADADILSKTVSVTGCTFKDIDGGIQFSDVDGVTVADNTFEESNGVWLERGTADIGCKNIKINDNIFRSVPPRGEGFAVKAVMDETAGYTGRVNLSDNFWGEDNAPEEMIIGYDSEYMDYYPYYLDEEFKTAITAEIRSVNLDQKSIEIYIGRNYTLEATVKPDEAAESTVVWSSSDEDVATVSQKGVVSGKSAGTATIRAESGGKYDTCKVTVVRRTSQNGGNGGNGGNNNNGGGIYIPDSNNNNTGSNTNTANGFSDVNTTDWFYDSVTKAVEKGLFSGVTENTFEPYARMTRAMLVTVLWRMDGSPAAGDAGFADVAPGEWYAAAVAWASGNGIVNGVTDELFAPEESVTREQIAAMAKRYADYKGLSLGAEQEEIAFTDGDQISDYAKDAVKTMQTAGIINGRGDGSFAPQGIATRAECAKILVMLSEK